MSLSLEQLQRIFSQAIVEKTIPPKLSEAIVGSRERLRARITLYHHHMHGAWRHALSTAYPVILALVGDECFSDLARAYGEAHPSVSGDLNTFGAKFADFVAAYPSTCELDYIGDVATFEWAVHRAHYAADAAPILRERITALSSSQLLASRFTLQPACSWMASAHPVCSIWLAHQEGTNVELSRITNTPEFGLVTRRRWSVAVERVTRGDVVALDALRAGANMDDTIAAALRADPAFDFGKAFVRWLDANLIVGFAAPALSVSAQR
jgi:hypothetical protein